MYVMCSECVLTEGEVVHDVADVGRFGVDVVMLGPSLDVEVTRNPTV